MENNGKQKEGVVFNCQSILVAIDGTLVCTTDHVHFFQVDGFAAMHMHSEKAIFPFQYSDQHGNINYFITQKYPKLN